MKRVRVAPGKFVLISAELAERAKKVFASGSLSREQALELGEAERRSSATVLAGPIGKTKRRRIGRR